MLEVSISVCMCIVPSRGGTLAELHQFMLGCPFTFTDFMEALVHHLSGIHPELCSQNEDHQWDICIHVSKEKLQKTL